MQLKPLTELASCAGCAAKLANEDLGDILSRLPAQTDERLLIGGGPDDAGVYRIDSETVLIQSVDFFTPIVDDPFDYGAIAATNAISDIYAMGAKPLTALNILGIPLQQVGARRLEQILSGGLSVAEKAGMALLGGHTIKSQEPLYGMAVTGIAGSEQWLKNGCCETGDLLILTKPLGTGIKTTSFMRGVIDENQLQEAVDWMTTPNEIGVELCQENLINGMTDITGFGLLQHLAELLAGQAGAEIFYSRVPFMDEVCELAGEGFVPGGTQSNWRAMKDKVAVKDDFTGLLLSDAQTSGGLLLAVKQGDIDKVQEKLDSRSLCSRVIGRVTDSPGIIISD
ncbi:MAG: selenide, water dikinase SelD [bacterium]